MADLWARDEWHAIFVALCHLSIPTLDWIESIFNTRAKEVYNPARTVSIDELSWPYKGRSRHRHYNPKKVHSQEISVLLTDSTVAAQVGATILCNGGPQTLLFPVEVRSRTIEE